MSPTLDRWTQLLAGASVEGALGAVLVFLLVRSGRRLSSKAKAGLWWVACFQFFAALAPSPLFGPSIPLPIALPANLAIPFGSIISASHFEPSLNRSGLSSTVSSGAVAPSAPGDGGGSAAKKFRDAASLAIFGLWALGATVVAGCGVRRLVRARRWATHNVNDLEGAGSRLASRLADRAGLSSCPRIVLSPHAPTAFLVSMGAPTIVVPDALWRRLDDTERSLVLAHEIAHVARRDALWSWVPWLAECVFWFHPLARLAAREYAIWRESACDADALRAQPSPPERYAELLVKLGTSPRLAWAGVGASSEFRSLKRRILMLDRTHERGGVRRLALAALFVAMFALVPLRFTFAAAPADKHDDSQSTKTRTTSRTTTWSDSENDGGVSFVLIDGNDSHSVGSIRDVRKAKALAKKIDKERFLVLRDKSGTYLVEDEASFAEARALFAKVDELGEKQGELGAKQGEFGEKQGELGNKQGELGARQGELGAQVAEISVEIEQAARRGRDTSELEAKLEEMSTHMEELGAMQEELGELQSKLGEQQSELGELQSELGERQERETAILREKLADFLERSREKGNAKRLDD